MNEIVLQVCNWCLEEKDVTAFHRRRLTCIRCRSVRYKNDLQVHRETNRNWSKNNRERCKQLSRDWFKDHKPAEIAKRYFRSSGFATKDIPADLLAAKIEQLKLIHLIKELQDEDRK